MHPTYWPIDSSQTPDGTRDYGLLKGKEGSLGGAAVWRLPLARGTILETRDRISRQAPGARSLLLPLPVSLPLCLPLCDYHE